MNDIFFLKKIPQAVHSEACTQSYFTIVKCFHNNSPSVYEALIGFNIWFQLKSLYFILVNLNILESNY